MKEHHLGLTVTLTALMGTVPGIAHAEESGKGQPSEPAIANLPQATSPQPEAVPTPSPTVEATTKIEFLTPSTLSSTPQFDSVQQTHLSAAPTVETTPTIEFSTRTELVKTLEKQESAIINAILTKPNASTSTAKSVVPISKPDIVGTTSTQATDLQAPPTIEQPVGELTQDSTDGALQNKLQRLEERQQQLEQQIDTLKQSCPILPRKASPKQ